MSYGTYVIELKPILIKFINRWDTRVRLQSYWHQVLHNSIMWFTLDFWSDDRFFMFSLFFLNFGVRIYIWPGPDFGEYQNQW